MLAWFALLIIAATLVVSSWRYPKFAFATGGVLLTVAVVYLAQEKLSEPGRAPAEQIRARLSALQFSPGYAGSYNLSGRIVNLGDSGTLEAVRLHIALLDCDDASNGTEVVDESNDDTAVVGSESDSVCITIGENTAQIFKRVPPQQARDFTHNTHIGTVRARGHHRWRVAIIQTTGG